MTAQSPAQPATQSKIQSPNSKIEYSWLDQFSDREQALIAACRDYATNHAEAGLPGHYLMLVTANLASLLDHLVEQFDLTFAPVRDDTKEQPAPPRWLPTPANPAMHSPATDKQLKAIYAIGKARSLTEEEIESRSLLRFELRPHELTKAQASELIDELKTT
jgi:hypothetical protein